MKVTVLISAAEVAPAGAIAAWRAVEEPPDELVVAGPQVAEGGEEPGLRRIACEAEQALTRGVEAASGELLLLADAGLRPTAGLLASHRAFHAEQEQPFSVACGPVGLSADVEPTPLGTHLHELRYGYLKDRDRAGVRLESNCSIKRRWLLEAGPFEAALDLEGQCRLMARRLVGRGLRTTYLEPARAERSASISNQQYLSAQLAEGRRQFLLYGLEADAVPHATRRYGARLIARAHRTGAGPGPEGLLAAALQGGVPDPQRLDRLEEVCWFEGFCQAAGEHWLADAQTLPMRFHQALDLGRSSPGLAEQAMRELQPLSPMVVGQARIRLLIKQEQFDQAAEVIAELLETPGRGCWPELQLLSGEVALAVGQLSLAEQAFESLYQSCRRSIESAWAICRLFRRYGPVPAARPHLRRILEDAAGRSARDIREVIEPASAWERELP